MFKIAVISQIIISSNLKVILKDEKALVYDSKTGENLIVKKGALTIINLLNQGLSLNEIKSKYNAPNLDIFIEKLIKKKLIHNEISEKSVQFLPISISDKKITEGSLLKYLRLNVTEQCNLNCSYCYEKVSKVYTKKRIMSWEIAKKSLEEFFCLVSMHKHKEVGIRFFGGEPLLNWSLIKQCIEYIKEKKPQSLNVKYKINTNGTLLTEDIIKTLQRNNVFITISLDGVKKYHDKARIFNNGRGSFEIIDRNINILIAYKCQFGYETVCADHNLPYMHQFIDYLKEKQDKAGYQIKLSLSPVSRIADRGNIDSLPLTKKIEYC